ncbi:MAG: tripartite tricarboxylate transporter substrate binding protein [Betaproteobacteria bacterium]|nr:tripartite tricarboxylate transporter substrate binding protein [Betaproteobacteria bacterium]
MLVGFAPGGAADIIGRIVTPRLSEALKQSVVIDNRAGASGIIATEMAARAAPDGYTLLVGTMTTHAIAPGLYKTLPYDAVKDFAPVVYLGSIPLMMSVSATLPVSSVKEFIALAKAAPGKYTFATAGNGTPPHLAGELFKLKTGIDLVHVPYKGTAPAVADLVSGQVSITIDGVAVQVPHVKSGKLRALATATEKRLAPLPDVPTFGEQGYAGLEMSLWYGVFAPSATPGTIVARLNAEISRVLAMPEVRQRLAELAVEPGGGTPEQFGAFMQTETKRWALVVQQANIKVE